MAHSSSCVFDPRWHTRAESPHATKACLAACSLTAHLSFFSPAFSPGTFSSNVLNNSAQFCGLQMRWSWNWQHIVALRSYISHWKIPTLLWSSCSYPNVCHSMYVCVDSSIGRLNLDHWFHSDGRDWPFKIFDLYFLNRSAQNLTF